ncbi:polysaccharide deacetylase family protein [Saliphagus sp. GCM10025334]
MKRRTYLATAGALTLGGCMGFGETDEPRGNDSNSNDPDGNETGNGDGNGNGNGDGNGDGNGEGNGDGDVPTEAETFDDFEDLSDWQVVSGSATPYTDYSVVGSQSVLLEASEEESQVRIARELDEPLDVTEITPGLAVASHSTVNVGIQLYDETRDKVVYRQRTHGMSIRHVNFGVEYINGDPDLSAISEIHISIWVGDGTAEAWIDDLHFVPKPDPTVLLQFDGGYESHLTEAMPLLEEYGYSATAFVPPSRLRASEDDEGDRLTADQVAELADAGWTIGSYGAHGNDLTALEGDRTPASEIEEAATWLEDEGYDAEYVAYPGGAYNDEAIEAVEANHELGFTGGYPVNGYLTNAALCPRLVHPDGDEAREALETTAELGGITAISFVRFDGGVGELEATLGHVQEFEEAGEIEVVTPQDVAGEYVL